MLGDPLKYIFCPAERNRIEDIINNFNARFTLQTGVTATLPALPVEELKLPKLVELKVEETK